MASNYSPYNPPSNQHPQYVYYTPAVARHPAASPYYVQQPAVPVQQHVPFGQLHPRSRSFNDLYTPYFAPQPAVPMPAMPAMRASAANLAFGPSPVASSVDHLPSLTQAAPPPPDSASADHAPADHAATATPGAAAASSGSSGSKPLRYRSRMARSKSHSMLLSQSSPQLGALGAPAAAPAASGHLLAAPGGGHGRRMSSTSSIQRHKNYSASMSSTDGSSTPSIMSVADTDSLTTQTSLSSTSSVDEDAKALKASHARRRSVVPSTVNERTLQNDNEAIDRKGETPKDLATNTEVHTNNTEAKNDKALRASLVHSEEKAAQEAQAAQATQAAQSAQTTQTTQSAQTAQTSQTAQSAQIAQTTRNTAEDRNDAAVSLSSERPLVSESQEATSRKFSDNSHDRVATANNTTDTETPATTASAGATTPTDNVPASVTVAGPITSKVPVSRLPSKHSQLQASEASQAREASVKPARTAKEALPPQENKDASSWKQPKETLPSKLSKKSELPPSPAEDKAIKTENIDSGESPEIRPLAWSKRATVATPSKLVLPSDLQPRSYSQSTGRSVSQDSVTPPSHGRSASWYTGAAASPAVSPTLPRNSYVDSEAAIRPRTPSAQSDKSDQSDQSTPSANSVFLRRSYASRQRPAVNSMPPRRPESYYGLEQKSIHHHPLPRQPSSSSTLSDRTPTRIPSPSASFSITPPHSQKSTTSRSFGSRLKGLFSKDKGSETPADDTSETASIASTKSSRSTMSIRSSNSGFSFTNRFRRKKNPGPETTEWPLPPAPAMTGHAPPVNAPSPSSPPSATAAKDLTRESPNSSPTERMSPRPPSPALSSIGRQVAPNLTAGDIYPGLLRPNEVDTIISSLERTGSFERKPSTSRRSKDEKVPDERVIMAPEPALQPHVPLKPLKSAFKANGSTQHRHTRRISFAKNTLVYNTYSAGEYNRTPEPLPYDLHDRRVVVQLYRELNDLKLSMPVHPSSKHHTQYLFDREERLANVSIN